MSGSPVEREALWWRTPKGRVRHAQSPALGGIPVVTPWARCGLFDPPKIDVNADLPKCKRCNAALLRALPGGGE